ncbi:MAG: hypothetical protein QCH31_01770 [Methanolobus sp.]|nr:hypothetical protein [Methanolobus sp.]
MLSGSMLRVLFIIMILFSCTATLAYASMFELEVVPISTITENPAAYDSTMAYRKISVIGNISELSKHSATLDDGMNSLKVDITRRELFEGLNISDQILVTGEFRYEHIEESVLIPTYVLHYPTDDMGTVNISSIVNEPSAYNGRYMTVTGNLSSLEMNMGRYVATVLDEEDNQLKVYYYGSTDLKKGDNVKIFGLFNGGFVHSERMGLNKSPLSISTLIPGFSSIMGAFALLSLALFLKSRRRND